MPSNDHEQTATNLGVCEAHLQGTFAALTFDEIHHFMHSYGNLLQLSDFMSCVLGQCLSLAK